METLQLNLVSSVARDDKASDVNKRKLDSDEDHRIHNEHGEKSKHKRKKSEHGAKENHNGTDTIGGAAATDKDFISSLFNHNPGIPQLELLGNVEPVQEAVFTSKGM